MSTPPLSSAQLDALLRRGMAAHQARRRQEARECYARVLVHRPGNGDALNLSGVLALQEGDAAGAVTLLRRATAANPHFADAWANLGSALRQCGEAGPAADALSRALALQPRHLQALVNRAAVRRELGDFAAAADDTERAFAISPDLPLPPAQAAADRARICDWSRRDHDLAAVRASIDQGRMPPASLTVLAMFDDPVLHRRLGALLAPRAEARPQFALPRNPVLRVGYFSGDFGENAVTALAIEAFELHDRTVIEPVAFAWGRRHDAGPLTSRVRSAFSEWCDISHLDDAAAAATARAAGIDIAVDLGGYTRSARPGLFAARPAPLQVAWLGYPATTGAGWCDYLLCDPVVAPPGADEHFSEALVRLPGCYQPQDSRRAIAPLPTRSAAGLPDDAFVFACFNQPYKITPELFAGWMGLLHEVPGSVLWLIGALPKAEANLRAAAAAHGIAGERLVFAPPLPWAQHYARHALADLALDTAPYTGHTTTSDALFAGLPVVTFIGRSFAARVAASILVAAGLPELVTASQAEALILARDLASDPARLADVRARLEASRTTAPLFDTPAFVRGLGAAYTLMHARRCAGLPPAPITIPPEPR